MTTARDLKRSIIEQIEAIKREAEERIAPLQAKLIELAHLEPMAPLSSCLICNRPVPTGQCCPHCKAESGS